jgi:hypothetical protein
MTREVLKMALDAMEQHGAAYLGHLTEYRKAIAAAKAALAQPVQPEQEAVLQSIKIPTDTMEQEFATHERRGYAKGFAAGKVSQPVQPEQEPVAWQWLDTATFRKKIPPTGESECWNPLYTSPPQRQPLSDEEIKEIFLREFGDLAVRIPPGWRKVVNAIEASHGIRDKT